MQTAILFIALSLFSGYVFADKYDETVCNAYDNEQDKAKCRSELMDNNSIKDIASSGNKKTKDHVKTNLSPSIEPDQSTDNDGWSLYQYLIVFFVGLFVYKRIFSGESKQAGSFVTVKFIYKDSSDNLTERTVDVKSGKRGNIFRGYCHLRQELRSFRFDRIAGGEVIEVDTGEILRPDQWRKKLQSGGYS